MAAPAPTTRPRVVVLALGERPQIADEAQRLRPLIEQVADVVVFDLEFKTDLSQVEADFAIVMGGDGSILRAAHQMGYHQIPILGVNLGKLGFLADLSPNELLSVLPHVCQGAYKVADHLMFECQVHSRRESHPPTARTERSLHFGRAAVRYSRRKPLR